LHEAEKDNNHSLFTRPTFSDFSSNQLQYGEFEMFRVTVPTILPFHSIHPPALGLSNPGLSWSLCQHFQLLTWYGCC